MFKKLFNKLFTKKSKQIKKETTSKEEKHWVTCEICGFEGSLNEFLETDKNDTICSRCGQDQQRFEV